MSKRCPDPNCGGELIERVKPGAWTGLTEIEKVCTNFDYHLQKRIREILKLDKKTAPP